METSKLILRMENQRWLCNEEDDLCSHGEIYLNVDGTIITQSGLEEEWGISESALALLRTLDQDYISDPVHDEGLIFHGCGVILMMGCPISIHWTVKHHADQVTLSNFVKVTTTNPQTGSHYYSGLEVKIDKDAYRKQVVQFALEAKQFFKNSKEKQILDDFDREMYEEFWNEYNQLLEKHLL